MSDPYEGCGFLESEYLFDRGNSIITKNRFKARVANGQHLAGLSFSTPIEEEEFVKNYTLYCATKTSNAQLMKDAAQACVKETLEKEREAADEIYWKECEDTKNYILRSILLNGAKHLFDRLAGPKEAERDTKLLEKIISMIDFKNNDECPENFKHTRASTKTIRAFAKTIFQDWASNRRKSMTRSLQQKKNPYKKFVDELIGKQIKSAVVENLQDIKSTMEKTRRAIYMKVLSLLIKTQLGDRFGITNIRLKLTDPVGHALMKFADALLIDAKQQPIEDSLKKLKENLKKKLKEHTE